MSKRYAIIDVETTGGKAERDRIIEIAIAIHDGQQVIDSFETLINPETTIPFGITQLTGITQSMVEDAPKFYEVAKKIVELTEKCIFVAHNARFDYSFIRHEFIRLGYTYSRKQLCTVRLARQTFPGLRSYSLDNLIYHFRIPIDNRHRAMGDVKATTILFEKILHYEAEQQNDNVDDLINLGVKESRLPKNITLEQLHQLPELAGVYYFHNIKGEVIYVGKSKNIRKRVMEHFVKMTNKAKKLQEQADDISYEVTGSELVALLLESYEIKRLQPSINRAQRSKNFPYIIHQYTNEEGFHCLAVGKPSAKMRKTLNIIAEYPKLKSAKGYLSRALFEYELCGYLCHVEANSRPCFNFHIHKCRGACAGQESPEEYNKRVTTARDYLSTVFENDFLVVDAGRTPTELAVVLVENGEYAGFGYLEKEEAYNEYALREAVQRKPGNPETAKIIQRFLAGKHQAKVIPFL